jgi:hypothetical protein
VAQNTIISALAELLAIHRGKHLEKMGYSGVVDAWWKFQDS